MSTANLLDPNSKFETFPKSLNPKIDIINSSVDQIGVDIVRLGGESIISIVN